MNFRIAASSTRAPLAPPSTAAFWLASVSTFFAAIYWLTNQMTSVRSDVGAAVFQWERAIPFIDWTIIPYGSIVAFFVASFFLCRNRAELNCHTARLVAVVTISVICFVLWPQRFVFERPAVDGALGVMFQLLSAVGEVPQFVQHGLTVSYGLSTRLCLVGSTLYMTLAKSPGTGTQRIQLLKKVGN